MRSARLYVLFLQQIFLGALGFFIASQADLVDFSEALQIGWSVLSGLVLALLLIGLGLGVERVLVRATANLDAAAVRFWQKAGIRFSPTTIVLVATGAGISEELLFRGALQSALVQHSSPLIGVILASLLFGLIHTISAAYVVASGLIALILGFAFELTGNLIVVIIGHALYDVWALRRLSRLLQNSEP